MKILIGQPKREKDLNQLETEVNYYKSLDVILYPESYFQKEYIAKVCEMARSNSTTIVTGYKDEMDLDRVLIINKDGEIILDRSKTPEEEALNMPSSVLDEGVKYGYVLCREVFQGLDGLKNEKSLDIIFNPIGVGMFSEEQYSEWSGEARKIAVQQNSFVIGASHADGSYRNCGFSIPIAFCFDQNGEVVFLSKNDTRSRIIDTVTKSVNVIDTPVKTK